MPSSWAPIKGKKDVWTPIKPAPAGRDSFKTLPRPSGLKTPVFGDDTGPLDPNHARLRSYDPPLVLECRLGENAPRISGGYGGWQEVERPKKMPLTEWQGSPPYRMEVDLLIDGWAAGTSVEAGVAILERMGRDPGGDAPPPFLRIRLPSGSPRSPKIAWVIENLEWGDSLRLRNGKRTRQAVTVTLLQFVDDEQLSPAKRRKKKKGKKSHPKTYTVANKTTSLMDIAKKFRVKWQTLKKANPSVRDPRRNLARGKRIRIP